jgi:predicted  nucleic acid-binding Zn-ribbon protein
MRMNGAENQKLVRARRKANGLCVRCGRLPELGKKMCRPCLDAACETMKRHHKRRFAEDAEYREWYRVKSRTSAAKRRSDPDMRAKLWTKARNAARARRDLIQEIKLQKGCVDCGFNAHPEALDFDHRDPTEKLRNVSCVKTLSLKSLMDEIAKCDVVCANCHRIRTYNRRRAAKAALQ